LDAGAQPPFSPSPISSTTSSGTPRKKQISSSSSTVKNTGNILKINIINKWSNRLMGDEVLKENYTTGNASGGAILYSSGLLGPVQLSILENK
jgi:hypothetical protein